MLRWMLLDSTVCKAYVYLKKKKVRSVTRASLEYLNYQAIRHV